MTMQASDRHEGVRVMLARLKNGERTRAEILCGLVLADECIGDSVHRYLSTGCLHDQHDYCKGDTGMVGAKRPACCKFCDAPCICTCHVEAPSGNAGK